MRIKLHNKLRDPQILEATRIVIEDDVGNPIIAAVEHGEHTVVFADIYDAEFPRLLKMLGITKTVLVVDASQKPLAGALWTP